MRSVFVVALGVIALVVGFSGPAQAAFSGANGPVAFFGAGGIYAVPSTGGVAVRTVADGYESSFSRDGTRLAFTTPASSSRRIKTARADGTDVLDFSRPGIAPRWTKDDRIVYTSLEPGVGPQIAVADPDGSNFQQLTNYQYVSGQPLISPVGPVPAADGRIYFTRNPNSSNLDVYRLTGSGPGTEPVIATSASETLLDVSPDASVLLYFSIPAGSSSGGTLRLRDLGTGSDRAVVAGPFSTAAFSPDGREIAYSTSTELRRINVDGSADRTFGASYTPASGTASYQLPAWGAAGASGPDPQPPVVPSEPVPPTTPTTPVTPVEPVPPTTTPAPEDDQSVSEDVLCESRLQDGGQASARIERGQRQVPLEDRGIFNCAAYNTKKALTLGVGYVTQGTIAVVGSALTVAVPVGAGVVGGSSAGPGGAFVAGAAGVAVSKEIIVPATSALFDSTGHLMGTTLEDPPDPKFRTTVKPARVPSARIARRKVGNARAARAIGRLVTEQRRFIAVADAMTATLDKAGGAKLAGQPHWEGVQMRLAISYARQIVTRAGRLAVLSRAAARSANRSSKLAKAFVSRTALTRQLRRASARGFSKTQTTYLRRTLKLTRAEVAGVRRRLRGLDVRTIPRSLPQLLSPAGIRDFYATIATGYREWVKTDAVKAAAAQP